MSIWTPGKKEVKKIFVNHEGTMKEVLSAYANQNGQKVKVFEKEPDTITFYVAICLNHYNNYNNSKMDGGREQFRIFKEGIESIELTNEIPLSTYYFSNSHFFAGRKQNSSAESVTSYCYFGDLYFPISITSTSESVHIFTQNELNPEFSRAGYDTLISIGDLDGSLNIKRGVCVNLLIGLKIVAKKFKFRYSIYDEGTATQQSYTRVYVYTDRNRLNIQGLLSDASHSSSVNYTGDSITTISYMNDSTQGSDIISYIKHNYESGSILQNFSAVADFSNNNANGLCFASVPSISISGYALSNVDMTWCELS